MSALYVTLLEFGLYAPFLFILVFTKHPEEDICLKREIQLDENSVLEEAVA